MNPHLFLLKYQSLQLGNSVLDVLDGVGTYYSRSGCNEVINCYHGMKMSTLTIMHRHIESSGLI